METRPVELEDHIEYGWVCPKCGGVYAPTQMFCMKCSSQLYSWTTTVSGDGTGYFRWLNDHVASNIAANIAAQKS